MSEGETYPTSDPIPGFEDCDFDTLLKEDVCTAKPSKSRPNYTDVWFGTVLESLAKHVGFSSIAVRRFSSIAVLSGSQILLHT